MKKFNSLEVAAIKRNAANVFPFIAKRQKINDKIAQLEEERNIINATIDSYDSATKHITGGYTTEDLIDKVVIETGKTDAKGNAIKLVKYVLKYPETVIPVETEEPFVEESSNETNDFNF